jgi:hypothetical protein
MKILCREQDSIIKVFKWIEHKKRFSEDATNEKYSIIKKTNLIK